MNLAFDLTSFVANEGAQLVTDSRAVALVFGKRHKNVLRAIDGMRHHAHPEIAEHHRLNFEPVEFVDAKGEKRPMYRITAKGLSELAMGFSGDDARLVRIRFLNAFEQVSQRLAHAERSLSERLMQWEREAAASKAKGQLGSKLMHQRRKEKNRIDTEGDVLLDLAQPQLFH